LEFKLILNIDEIVRKIEISASSIGSGMCCGIKEQNKK